jgi:hypothetical protein
MIAAIPTNDVAASAAALSPTSDRGPVLDRGLAEPVDRDREHAEDDRAQAIEGVAHHRHAAEGGCERAQSQHDHEGGCHEGEAREHAAPAAGALMPDKDAHLHRGGAGQRVDQRHALEEALLAQPAASLLHFGLDQPPDRRRTIAERADLEERADHFQPSPDIWVHVQLLNRPACPFAAWPRPPRAFAGTG